ncbi:MAG: type VI secretion system tube protein Hcp [Opitutaceae bacterium]|jgi:type VI protein secretion system component Hcp|nr:type VI secretion system tube protein Hcp [Opitutaceae bacterium]
MPLYAYIKIPGIENSESTDAAYGKAWIPIRKFDLKGGTNEGMKTRVTAMQTISRQRKERREQLREIGMVDIGGLFDSEEARRAEIREERAARRNQLQEIGMVDIGGLFDSEEERRAKIRKERAARRKEAADFENMDFRLNELFDVKEEDGPSEEEDRQSSEGRVTVEKMIDSASPKLQLMCLECGLYDSSKYITGKVEVHICRQIPGDGDGPARNEVYMAYVLENCLITSVAVDASESSKLQETVAISYEKISACIKTDKGTWDSKGWDFIEEKEVGPAPPSKP